MKKLFVSICTCAFVLLAGGWTKDTPKNQGKTSLRFSWWGGKERHEATLKVIEMFKEKHPDVEIISEYSGYDGYLQKLTTQLAGSNAPDIIQIDRAWMNDFQNMGGNLFSDLKKEKNLDFSNFEEKFLKETGYMNDTLVAIPLGVAARCWMYNDKNMKAIGVQPENITWESFLEYAPKIREMNTQGYAMGIIPKDAMRIILEYSVQTTGKNLFTKDNKVQMTPEELRIGMEYFKKLVDSKAVPPLDETVVYNDKPGDNPKVINGNYTFLPTWSSALKNYSFSEGEINMINYPVISGAQNTGIEVRPSMLVAVNEKSKNKAVAAEFINYMVSDEEAIKVLQDLRGIPASKKANQVLEANGMISPMQAKAVQDGIKYQGETINALLDNPEIEMIYNHIVQQLWLGQITPEKASKEMIEEMTDKLEELF